MKRNKQGCIRVVKPQPSRRFIGVKDLTSAVAKWAVNLSPYPCPHNLLAAMRAVDARALHFLTALDRYGKMKSWGFIKATEKQIKTVVRDLVHCTKETRAWNRCRKGRTPAFQITSAFSHKPDPDRTFIDLDAICQGIMCDFRKEWDADDQEKERLATRGREFVTPASPPTEMSTKRGHPVARARAVKK